MVLIGLGSLGGKGEVTKGLFVTSRVVDERGIDCILAIAPVQEGIEVAVFGWLVNAWGSRVIESG